MNITIDNHEVITGWYGLPSYKNHTHWADVDGKTIGTDFPTREAALAAARAYIKERGE